MAGVIDGPTAHQSSSSSKPGVLLVVLHLVPFIIRTVYMSISSLMMAQVTFITKKQITFTQARQWTFDPFVGRCRAESSDVDTAGHC